MRTQARPSEAGDLRRDADKYRRLVIALKDVTNVLQSDASQAQQDFDAALEPLLPDLCEAFNAGLAFAGRIHGPTNGNPAVMEITAAYPNAALRGDTLPVQGVLADLLRDGRPRVLDSLGAPAPRLIPGLEKLSATEAIVVSGFSLSPIRLIGVCNKRDPDLGPYLAADGWVLDNIIETLAVGARIGERHLQQLKAIQATSAAAIRLTTPATLLPYISQQAAEVFEADASSVMLWDQTGENLVIQGSWGLSEGYINKMRIPRAGVEEELRRSGSGPLLTPDLRLRPFAQLELILAEGLCTALSAPLMYDDEPIGVLNIYSREVLRDFSAEDRELVMIYANQTVVALQNARLFQETHQRSQHWEALYGASKAISAGFTADRRVVLDHIVAQAVERISVISGPKPVSGILQLYFPETHELAFESVYPPELWSELRARVGERRSLDRATVPGGRIGITGRAALEGQAQRVDDVRSDPDYLEVNSSTASELAAPLLQDGEVIGVLSLESETPAAFDENDELALCALADFAVIATRNSAAAEDLSRANAVAMLGAWAADVIHDLNREIGAIRRSVYILKRRTRLKGELRERLDEIDRGVERLAFFALPEEPARRGVFTDPWNSAPVDEVIRRELAAYGAEYPWAAWECDLGCTGVRAAMHEQWLSRLLHHLMRNALEHMGNRPAPTVWLRTTLDGGMVHIEVEDNGTGVRPEIVNLLFRRAIPHDEPGRVRGRGLLLARFLAEQHGGKIWLSRNTPGGGACFRLTIPVVPLE
jgi:signal transduction histidine kinase